MRTLVAILGLAMVWAWTTSANADEYGAWKYDAKKNRYHCKFTYKGKNGDDYYQTVLWYPPADSQRTGYYYWANDKDVIWSRCTCKGNAKYDPDPKKMRWDTVQGDTWTSLDVGKCPVFKGKGGGIDNIPDPPVGKPTGDGPKGADDDPGPIPPPGTIGD